MARLAYVAWALVTCGLMVRLILSRSDGRVSAAPAKQSVIGQAVRTNGAEADDPRGAVVWPVASGVARAMHFEASYPARLPEPAPSRAALRPASPVRIPPTEISNSQRQMGPLPPERLANRSEVDEITAEHSLGLEARPIDLSHSMWPTASERPTASQGGSFERLAELPVLSPADGSLPPFDDLPVAAENSEPPETPAAPDPPTLAVDWRNDEVLAAVSMQAGGLVERAIGLAEKGALYSARAEFLQALQTVSKSLDARVGDSSFTQALIAGVQAFREADDFVASGSKLLAEVDAVSLVARHRTPVLKDADVSRLPAVMAMQQYYAYAQDRLARSCANAPVASQAFWGLGRVYASLAAQSPQGERLNSPRAIALYQVALAIDPRNYRAANELGVLLARFGQLREARDVLRQSVGAGAMPETWHNLAVVHARLGESDLAVLARNELALSQGVVPGRTQPQVASSSPSVQWVDPAAFAQTGQPAEPIAQPAAPAGPPRGERPPRTASRAPGFWPW